MVVMDSMSKDYEMSTRREYKIIPCNEEFPVHQTR